MFHIEEYQKNNCGIILYVVIALVIICLISMYLCPSPTQNEPFTVPLQKENQFVKLENQKEIINNPSIYKQADINIKPEYYDDYTRTVQSGQEFMHQKNMYTPWGTLTDKGNIFDDNDESDKGPNLTDMSLNTNQCSIACCSDQWPLPFKMPVENSLCGSKDDYVPTNYYCNNGWQNSGCLCMTKEQESYISNRGNNTEGKY